MEGNNRSITEIRDQLKGYYKAHKMLNKENRQLQSIIKHVSEIAAESIADMQIQVEENLKKMELIEKGIEICEAEEKFLDEWAEVNYWENDERQEKWYTDTIDKCMEQDEAEAKAEWDEVVKVGKSFYRVPNTDFEIDLIDIRRENK